VITAPVEESKTIYDAFIRDEEKKERKARELEQARIQSNQATNSGGGGGANKKGGPSNKKTGEKAGGDRKKEKPIKLEEAVSLVNTAPCMFVTFLLYPHRSVSAI